ncbi:uncharacterized protein LOC123204343 [Mangifera indica]|uniref:uncharacterized protein LOC123204343 n=1 Tax=Mangifera indica TaxID=29780 RepID=UPI001CF9A588|nr:uncharacterized protein LOC123204343 [Mangifera indica]
MNNLLHCIVFTVFCISVFIPSSYCNDKQFEECSSIYPFSCGASFELNIFYPFWGYGRPRRCGRAEFELTCEEGSIHPVLKYSPQKLRVLGINTTDQTVTILRKDLPRNFSSCFDRAEVSVEFDRFLHSYSSNVRNLSLFYNCTDETQLGPYNYTCHQQGSEERRGFYTIDDVPEYFLNITDTVTCSEVTKVPIQLDIDSFLKLAPPGNLECLREILDRGLEVKYDAKNGFCSACQLSGGICGSSESNPGEFVCLCRDKPHRLTCPGNEAQISLNLGSGIASAIIGMTIMSIIICICRRKKMSSNMLNFFPKDMTKNDKDIEAFIRDYGSLAPKRYSFLEVKRMTNSFKDKLGQGGYGGVYKGKSLDGNIVAVKLLNASKGNGLEFINEVISITRTSHVNVVRLLGFCLEGNEKALIYEFMKNGSLEKFIYNEKNLQASQCLEWERMYEIAIGIARGLEYLHRGCSTRILHFDIKPHNILLDENLCPKISDFGLAKLCLNKESIVSMLEARGTIGYIAPEVFMRNFGEVSHKSDVYSYGMMILEMVGGRKSQDIEGALHSSEKYFPHWIYKHVEQGKELKWHGANNSEKNEIAKKMIIVGLWCIQTRPSNRPSINKVLDLLQASSEDLPIPPEPFESSPPRLQVFSSTISMCIAYSLDSASDDDSHYYSFAGFGEELFKNYSCKSFVYASLNVETGADLWEMNYIEILKMGFHHLFRRKRWWKIFLVHFSSTLNNLIRKFDIYTSHISPTRSYLSLTMNNLLHCIVFTVFCISVFIPSSHCNDKRFEECSRIYPFSCGASVELNIFYPFWGYGRPRRCGRAEFELTCEEGTIHPVLKYSPQKLQVLGINTTDQTLTILRKDLPWNFSSCFDRAENSVEFDRFLYSYSSNVRNLSLFYNCTDDTQLGPHNYICRQQGREEKKGFYTIDDEPEIFPNYTDTVTCSEVTKVPIQLDINALLKSGPRGNLEWLGEILDRGLEVKYDAKNGLCSECQLSGGLCGSSESNPGEFVCLCREKPHILTCPGKGHEAQISLNLGSAISSAIIGMTIMSIIICICRKKKMSSNMSNFLSKDMTKNDKDIEAFIRDYGSLAPKRYSFSEVERMTNSFKDKLGQGGYGGVYKGKSLDGNIVAVKLLNASKGNGQEFINEVISISRTSHVNVVRLLGFCLEGNEKALIYEFMVNGSLEKFIYNEKNLQSSQCLGWEKMYEIAIGITRGLEYLHRGCSTRILHFDIKPHNILLDENLCPKISDFGLAKLCLNKESIVSMLEARGTIGYIAPEVFMRNFGEVSHKSDVYSYGMMILEMVGGRKSQDAEGALHSSEMYFPHWIYKHLEQGKELKWHGVNNNEENEIAKKMIIVGLWCIQTRPSDRPSMNKVLDLLQASSEDLPIPPEPFLSSPPRLRVFSSTTSIS